MERRVSLVDGRAQHTELLQKDVVMVTSCSAASTSTSDGGTMAVRLVVIVYSFGRKIAEYGPGLLPFKLRGSEASYLDASRVFINGQVFTVGFSGKKRLPGDGWTPKYMRIKIEQAK